MNKISITNSTTALTLNRTRYVCMCGCMNVLLIPNKIRCIWSNNKNKNKK